MWYQILVFVLFCLAIIDLTVGVSNDAANFLNSAIGSKVASFKTILIIASIGVLVWGRILRRHDGSGTKRNIRAEFLHLR